MNMLFNLLLTEIIPLGLIIFGGICDTKSTKYPNIKIGYKNNYSKKDRLSWEYSNKLVAKIYGFVGTFLFIINAILIFIIGESIIIFILIFSLFIATLSKMIINALLKKRFEDK